MKVVTILYPMNKLAPIPPKKARALAGFIRFKLVHVVWSNTKLAHIVSYLYYNIIIRKVVLCLMTTNEEGIM